jgi:leucyl-tRNA synthetase
MRIRDVAIDLFFNALNDIRDLENFAGKERTLRAVRKFAREWILSLSPIMPFVTEELFSIYHCEGFASLQRFPSMENTYKHAERQWDFIQSLIEDYRNIIKVSGLKPKVMKISLAEDWKWDLLERARNEDMGKMIKEVQGEARDFLLSLMKRKIPEPGIRNEREPIEAYREDMEKFLGIKIEITEEGKRKAIPGRPSITLV